MPAGTGAEAIEGKDDGGAFGKEAAKVTAAQIKTKYASVKFVLPDASNNVNLLTLAPTAFTNNKVVHSILVRSNAGISIRLNLVGNDPIEIDQDAPFPYAATEIKAIFLTNVSGGDATVRFNLS